MSRQEIIQELEKTTKAREALLQKKNAIENEIQ